MRLPLPYAPPRVAASVLAALVTVLLAAGATTCAGQVFSNEFLSIGAGARAQALGNSVVASSEGIYAAYWNPAGLAAVSEETGLLAGAMHAEQFAGVGKYDFVGVSLPLANGGRRIGISLIRQGVDDIPNTINLYNPDGSVDYDQITSFGVADYAVLLSYAQPTRWLGGDKVSVGGNLKVIRRVIGDFSSAWGVGIDLGARYVSGAWQAGLMVRDATSTFNAWKTDLDDRTREVLVQEGNTLPDRSGSETTRPSVLPAVRYRFQVKDIGIAPELAAWVTFDGQRNTLLSADPVSADVNLGVEADYKRIAFVRIGADQWQRYAPLGEEESLGFRPAVGLGIAVKGVKLDYAFSNPGDGEELYAHVVSLQVALKRPEAR